MPECKHCNNHVSEKFRRVFSNRNGEVHACPECSATAGIEEVSKSRK